MNSFNQLLKKELNKQQQKAVNHKKGALIVVAGAGSGKTRIITCRIANLIINEKIDPTSILALTFTNKAAGEMKERLLHFLGTGYKLPFVGTFHAYCLQLLRTNFSLLPYKDFTILDEEDQKSLIKKILRQNSLEKQFSAGDILSIISNIKNKLGQAETDSITHPVVKEIHLAYETEKSNSHTLDFDDLLLEVLKFFKNNKEFKERFQQKIRHVLVDEYQDTNMVQHELLRSIGLDSKQKFALDSICVVGDEDQSIYSWRGAIATNMLQFQEDFNPVSLIKIEQNYRSVQPILQAANNVILNNKTRTPKELWSERKAKDRILSISCRSGLQEADIITTFLSNFPKEKKLNDVAILYRTHFQSRTIEESLIRNSIPYKIIGGIRFYERKEIKDLLAYMRLIVNPFDRTSFFRVINCPTRGLGEKFEEILYTEWNKNPLLNFEQLFEYILNVSEISIPRGKKESIDQFLNIFRGIEKNQKTSSILNSIIEQTEFLSFIQKTHDPREAETKIENVKEFVQSTYNFEHQSSNATLENFLSEIALMQEKTENKENRENEVQCMTLHAAKGLEFDTVIITGLEEGLFPSMRTLSTLQVFEEERRLFYVGITRAKERLLLLHAQARHSFGQINDQVVSRFLEEIPNNLLKNIDASEMHIYQIKSLINEWLGQRSKSVLTFKDFGTKAHHAIQVTRPTTFVPHHKHTSTYSIHPEKPPRGISRGQHNKAIDHKTCQQADSLWEKNQLILHKTFGTGIITKVEKKDNAQFYITAIFKCGEKRVLSDFLTHP